MGDVLTACSLCLRERLLLAHVVGDRWLCASCWKKSGEPAPFPVGDQHQAEVATRERMAARGGTDRHLVRAGRT